MRYSEDDRPLERADRTEQQAADWLAQMDRSYEGFLDENAIDVFAEQNSAFRAWLNSSLYNRLALVRLLGAWARADRMAALKAPLKAKRRFVYTLLHWPAITGMAASFVVAVCAVLLFAGADFSTLFQTKTYQTAVGGREAVALADGTHVLLNTDTEMEALVTEKVRKVSLRKGEAFFDVAHDAARPFVVDAGDQRITVLGTKFSVYRTEKGVQVAVSDGKVRIDPLGVPDNKGAPAYATKGDIAHAEKDSVLIARQKTEEVERRLSWRDGFIVFNQSPLSEAATEFNRYNHVHLVISDPDIADIEIGGKFKVHNVEAFARLLAEGFGLNVIYDGNKIFVTSPNVYRKTGTASS